MLPDNPLAWIMFGLYTLGSVGGIVYIANLIVDKIVERSMRNEYDPWAAQQQPIYTAKEPPISARNK